MSLLSLDPTVNPYLTLILIGFLPSEVWRVLSVFIAHHIDEESELFQLVRSIATVLLFGVVAKFVLGASGELARVPIAARVLAILAGGVSFFAFKRSVFAAIVAGEAAIIFAAWRFAA